MLYMIIIKDRYPHAHVIYDWPFLAVCPSGDRPSSFAFTTASSPHQRIKTSGRNDLFNGNCKHVYTIFTPKMKYSSRPKDLSLLYYNFPPPPPPHPVSYIIIVYYARIHDRVSDGYSTESERRRRSQYICELRLKRTREFTHCTYIIGVSISNKFTDNKIPQQRYHLRWEGGRLVLGRNFLLLFYVGNKLDWMQGKIPIILHSFSWQFGNFTL